MSMRYRTIVADPPWPLAYHGGGTRKGGIWSTSLYTSKRPAGLGYPTMTLEAICALDVAGLAADDAHLYLWIPDRLLIEGAAARVIAAWEFKPGRTLIWKKRNYGLGAFPRPQHETVVLAKRGKLPYGATDVGSVQEWPHVYEYAGPVKAKVGSAKPPAFLDLVEQVSPGPYLELFARRQRLGWDTWGDEALCHVELA
jgi:N6-adenosine-specific RNA methylase IME4